jgi:hypothetical protein
LPRKSIPIRMIGFRYSTSRRLGRSASWSRQTYRSFTCEAYDVDHVRHVRLTLLLQVDQAVLLDGDSERVHRLNAKPLGSLSPRGVILRRGATGTAALRPATAEADETRQLCRGDRAAAPLREERLVGAAGTRSGWKPAGGVASGSLPV